MTPEVALSQLVEAEANLCAALADNNNEEILQNSLATVCSVALQLQQLCPDDLIDSKAWTQVAHAVQRIQIITASCTDQEAKLSQHGKDLVEDVELLWRMQGPSAPASRVVPSTLGRGRTPDLDLAQTKPGTIPSDHSEQSLNAVVMRRWMLDHIEHPFPNTQDKEEIADETNRGLCGAKGQLRPEQATLWFINTRRRSGWTTWARRFANSDKSRLRAIVAAIQSRALDVSGVKVEEVQDSLVELVQAYDCRDRGLTKTELAELCRSEFCKVTEWIEQGSKDKVGDWMDKVVSEARATLKRKKQERRAARKLLADRRRDRAALTRDVEMEESEEELAEEQLPAQSRLDLRPIRHMPQQRTVSGSSSSSSCLSSVVSGRLHPSRSSSSSATSFDSTYERGTSSRRCATDFKTETTGLFFQQMQVDGDQPNLHLSPPYLTRRLSRLPPFAPQQHQWAEQERLASEEQQASVAYFQPPTTSTWSAATGAGTMVYDQRSDDSQSFFMPSVTAAAALGNNWGMPVAASEVDHGVTGQSYEAVNCGGWLAWNGQMMTGEA